MKKTNDYFNGYIHSHAYQYQSRAARFVMQASLCLALCASFAPHARAQASDAVPDSEVSHSARAWIELQRSNAQAAPALPMLGAEAGYAWRRYLKSFDSTIPASFGSSVDSSGSGQGQGGGFGPATSTSSY
ncbi:DUF3613 domain-containing protein [Paraburkholderia sp. J12]|uniref:DUF3613 domain-containing protein n=1 Tax=Paraburkholderia sp. J12 TaxID=2805432 RepID=UPI002ABE9A40|nr:DUF3613 domain-containing protein [Paraburkholderia sp. J12]